jgi:hypothetical protein
MQDARGTYVVTPVALCGEIQIHEAMC